MSVLRRSVESAPHLGPSPILYERPLLVKAVTRSQILEFPVMNGR